MVEVMKIMAPPSKGSLQALPPSVSLALQLATAHPRLCWRLLDTHGQVWVSLMGSLLLSPGGLKVLFVPSKSLFPSPVSVLVALWWG